MNRLSLFWGLIIIAIPTWASVNLSDKWDILEGKSGGKTVYVARSPFTLSFQMETGLNTGISIYVASPTYKYNYCSASLNIVVDDERANVDKQGELIAKWIGTKGTVTQHSLLYPNKETMIKSPENFIKNLMKYDKVELAYILAGGQIVKNTVSLKGSSKAIQKACSVSKYKRSVRPKVSRKDKIKRKIEVEMDKVIATGSFCGSELYYRMIGGSLYVGVRGISRDQEILQPANSPHWENARLIRRTPPFDTKIRSGRPFWLDELCN